MTTKAPTNASKPRKRRTKEADGWPYPSRFGETIRHSPSSVPHCLLRVLHRPQSSASSAGNKVKVVLRLTTASSATQSSPTLVASACGKQLTVRDPAPGARKGPSTTKTYTFDHVFNEDDHLPAICSGVLPEILSSILHGSDGCIISYGHRKAGKVTTMIGRDETCQSFGVIPSAISWLYKLIGEQSRGGAGARFSLRVSALEADSIDDSIKDLLSSQQPENDAQGMIGGRGPYLREDPIYGTHIENLKELRASTPEAAATFFDAALAKRVSRSNESGDLEYTTHLVFTLHIYQYRVDKSDTGPPTISGGRSKLHLIDFGSFPSSKEATGQQMTLANLGNVMLSLLSGQRSLSCRSSQLTQILREPLGNMNCHICLIAHASPAAADFASSHQAVQLAAKTFRAKRRQYKGRYTSSQASGNSSSDDSSCDDRASKSRHHQRRHVNALGTLHEGPSSDPECTSSSEHSMDTVIFIGTSSPSRRRVSTGASSMASGSTLSALSSGSSDASSNTIFGAETIRTATPTDSGISETMTGDSGSRGNSGYSDEHIHVTSTIPKCNSPAYSSLPRRQGNNPDETKFHRQSTDSPPGHHYLTSFEAQYAKPTGELWVDGPASRIYPDHGRQEVWIDGPKQFQVRTPPPETVLQTRSGSLRRKKYRLKEWGDIPIGDRPGDRPSPSKEYWLGGNPEDSPQRHTPKGNVMTTSKVSEDSLQRRTRKAKTPVSTAVRSGDRTANWVRNLDHQLTAGHSKDDFVKSLKQRLMAVQRERGDVDCRNLRAPCVPENALTNSASQWSSSSSDTKQDSDAENYEKALDDRLENITPNSSNGSDPLSEDEPYTKPTALLRTPDGASNPDVSIEPLDSLQQSLKTFYEFEKQMNGKLDPISSDEFILSTQSAPVTPSLQRRLNESKPSPPPPPPKSAPRPKPEILPKPIDCGGRTKLLSKLTSGLKSPKKTSPQQLSRKSSVSNSGKNTPTKGGSPQSTPSKAARVAPILRSRSRSKSPTAFVRNHFVYSSLRSAPKAPPAKPKPTAPSRLSRTTDSDSGVDSGVSQLSDGSGSANGSEKIVASPYAKVTRPRLSTTSSSGHGSDNSSSKSAERPLQIHQSPDTDESARNRCQSAPPTAVSAPGTPRAGRRGSLAKMSAIPIPISASPIRRPLASRSARAATELLERQKALRNDLLDAKKRLISHSTSHNSELSAAAILSQEDPKYLEALEKETYLLEKRVAACKTRILMVTSFDTTKPHSTETTV